MNKKARRVRIKHHRRSKHMHPEIVSTGKGEITVIGRLDPAQVVDFLDDLALIDLNRFVKVLREEHDNCIILKIIVPKICEFLFRSSLESGFLRRWDLYFSFETV